MGVIICYCLGSETHDCGPFNKMFTKQNTRFDLTLEQSRGKPINVRRRDFYFETSHQGLIAIFLTPHPGKLIKFLKLKKFHQNQVSGLDFRAVQSSQSMSKVKKLRLKSSKNGKNNDFEKN